MHLDLAGHRPLHAPELPLQDHAAGQGPVIDARRLEFASPLDLAATATLAARLRATSGEPPELLLPTDQNIASYLRRMDLLKHLPPDIKITGTLPPEERKDHSDKLLEITRLTPDNADEIGARIGTLAVGLLGASLGARAFQAVGELIDNATTHGHSDTAAYICAQAYTGRTTSHPGLQVAVCDTGIGIRDHLRRNPQYADVADHVHALQRVLEPGVTGTGDQRGNGLPDALGAGVPAGGTHFLLRSGDGLLTVRRSPGEEPTVSVVPDAVRVNGTWVWLDLSFPR